MTTTLIRCSICSSTWTGQGRSHCLSCHETFSDVDAFTAHRAGRMRTCLSVERMRAADLYPRFLQASDDNVTRIWFYRPKDEIAAPALEPYPEVRDILQRYLKLTPTERSRLVDISDPEDVRRESGMIRAAAVLDRMHFPTSHARRIIGQYNPEHRSTARAYALQDTMSATVWALAARGRFSDRWYAMLTEPWASIVGKVHPDDEDRRIGWEEEDVWVEKTFTKDGDPQYRWACKVPGCTQGKVYERRGYAYRAAENHRQKHGL